MTLKNAIVFGGAGFIGSHLLRELAESGAYAELVCADITPPRFRVDGVRYVDCDVREPISETLSFKVDEIYNLAAVHTTPGHEDWEYYWTNALGATHVTEYARKVGCKTILFTSSIAVYGPSEEAKDENSILEPESAYGRSKLIAEKIHRNWRAERPDERRLVVVRPAVIYGYTERGNFTRLARLLARKRFVYPGRKDTIKSCGYVRDLVGSFAFMLAQPEPEITYNFSHPERYTAEDICKAFSRVGGYDLPTRVLPLGLMMPAAQGFEVLGAIGLKTPINRARILKLNRSTNILPAALQARGFQYRYSLDSALADWKAMSSATDFD